VSELQRPRTLVEVLEDFPDLLTDPFLDDEPLECGLEDPEVCESCQ